MKALQQAAGVRLPFGVFFLSDRVAQKYIIFVRDQHEEATMLTETIVELPSTMGCSRPSKRRRLATPSSSSNVSSPAKDVVKPITVTVPVTAAIHSCVSCHRALKAAQGLLVICARTRDAN
ncbi:hypothetical protein C0995_004552 [Termitomyces sp. Mi166|nr:hypothetical protein C0995_004552 [Termitomyces sp. Mi166\